MTTRKEALQDLLAKVEAGEWDALLSHVTIGNGDHPWKAYNGSLDAAKALHEAVLPGWYVFVKGQKGYMWIVELDHDDFGRSDPCEDATPARAWLIAIIKALISQEPT